jgi:pimeloyl-ACP methyl ester carboxylesterase
MLQTHHFVARVGVDCKECWAYFSVAPARRAIFFVHGLKGSALDTWTQFQSLLQSQQTCAKTDLFFFGYYSLRRSTASSAASLFDFLQLLNKAPERLYGWPKDRPSPFRYEQLIIVAHSLGAIVTRRCLLTATAKNVPWVQRCKLILFAPAHLGGRPLKLIPKGIKPVAEVIFPALEELDEHSEVIRTLQEDTARALATGKCPCLRALLVVHGGADTIVCRQDKQFCDDPPSEWIQDADHIQICKPRPGFLGPLERLLEAL